MSGPSFLRLVGVEFRRTCARRLVRLLVAVAALGIVIAGVVTFLHSSRTPKTVTVFGPGRIVNGVCEPVNFEPAQPDQDNPFGPKFLGPGEEGCPARVQVVRDQRFKYARLNDNEDPLLHVLAPPLILAAIFAGASLVGAEWRYGTVGVLLTWEPRRIRVLVAKVIAAVAVAFITAVLLEGLLCLALWPAAALRGTMAGVDAAWWRGALQIIGRVGFVTALFGLIGLSVGSIGRNTSAAIGGALAYLVVGEAALRAARPHWAHWFLIENTAEVVNGHRLAGGTHGAAVAAGLLLLYAGILLVIATALFATRDVT
jgi:ABC-2 type transport system permease protein